ncbi:MAG: 16S rRNA (adenine(1518)-N(6)/adenine(1519)-N(6))-dimethyltransferase RsmA [Bernardetiaceae bacterium]|jgi:16S rRNA (adenine1518-N6/adenine1519-N6)-dimethyltransferase|nr:16S rRNA (adenine(1518)-N(6)/adenine(1519)-N(6))-dimethyltransferase RsmA [Bernardetiaceae bacterium]
MNVRPKKHLGQHFLTDLDIARAIAERLTGFGGYQTVLEIGPGKGVLTQFLVQNPAFATHVIDIDGESITYLAQSGLLAPERIVKGDFLALDLARQFGPGPLGLIGNLPYNISSQIFFKLLANRHQVPEMVCMVQKEVAERIAARHGNKTYGILSVLLQAFYHIQYEFTVHENVFQPPPKVKSGVLSLRRNQVAQLACNEKLFFTVVKMGFNQRRKTLRNALGGLIKKGPATEELLRQPVFNLRAEQLSVPDFEQLTAQLEPYLHPAAPSPTPE